MNADLASLTEPIVFGTKVEESIKFFCIDANKIPTKIFAYFGKFEISLLSEGFIRMVRIAQIYLFFQ